LEENARKLGKDGPLDPDYISAEARPSKRPPRKFCAVSGNLAKYKDRGSQLYFSSFKTGEQVQNQPPPWVRLSGEAPYYEALRMIKRERTEAEQKRQQAAARSGNPI
jgi:hypothetical protein